MWLGVIRTSSIFYSALQNSQMSIEVNVEDCWAKLS